LSLTFLIGGARSGKSSLAVELARGQDAPVMFVATGEAGDDEMAERIALHRSERPKDWTTVEEPIALERVLGSAPADACVVVDCLSLWVANLIEHRPADTIEQEGARAATLAAGRPGRTIAVSNEVGLGIVPSTPLGRAYRDVLGRVNAAWARTAVDAYLVVAGRALRLEEPPRG
jgi:adenosyl cobinamide kinase/adenosyl cobinamide phosphate guanylyltransferase